MTFSEISDPHGICKDVTGLGRWGNGDIEVEFSEITELPYIMSLVRQSFNKQMNNDY
jgi:predicted transport protein